jgi:hypothetical protein
MIKELNQQDEIRTRVDGKEDEDLRYITFLVKGDNGNHSSFDRCYIRECPRRV